jgi:hypothetical protein
MKHYATAACLFVVVSVALFGCSSMGSAGSAMNVYEKLGGSKNLSSVASGFVNSSLKDPRLSALTGGKNIDASAVSGKVSNQLCSMLGGGCTAPMTDSQLTSAASKVNPDQSKAISDNFTSALNSVVSDPQVRELVTKTVGSKVPSVLAGLL